MEVYRISREEMLKWCSIPMEQLENHPDSKVDLKIFDSRKLIYASEHGIALRSAEPFSDAKGINAGALRDKLTDNVFVKRI